MATVGESADALAVARSPHWGHITHTYNKPPTSWPKQLGMRMHKRLVLLVLHLNSEFPQAGVPRPLLILLSHQLPHSLLSEVYTGDP